jgi:hypothetical protein
LLRTAYLAGEAGVVPLGVPGWTVYSTKKAAFVESGKQLSMGGESVGATGEPIRVSSDLGLSVAVKQEPEEPAEEYKSSPDTVLSKWESLEEVQEPVSTKVDKLEEIEKTIAALQEQIKNLEDLAAKMSSSPTAPKPESVVEKLRCLGRSITNAIDSLGAGQEMVAVGFVPKSFERERAEESKLARLEDQRKLIARKLRPV